MRLQSNWQMAELSLKARCSTLGSQLQTAVLTRLQINHADICACPLPLLSQEPKEEKPLLLRPPLESQGLKVQWVSHTVEMKHSFCFIFQFPPRLNMRLNCVFTARSFFTFQMNAFTICLWFLCGKSLSSPLRSGIVYHLFVGLFLYWLFIQLVF